MMSSITQTHVIWAAEDIQGVLWIWYDDTFGDPVQPAIIWIAPNARIAFVEALKCPDRFDATAQSNLLAKAAFAAAHGLLHVDDLAAWEAFCANGFAALPASYQGGGWSWLADSLGQPDTQAMILTTENVNISFEDCFKFWERFTPEARRTIESRADMFFQQGLLHPGDSRVWLAHVSGGER